MTFGATTWATDFTVWATGKTVAQTVSPQSHPVEGYDEVVFRVKVAEISDMLTNNEENRPQKCDILAKSIISWLRNFQAGNLIWVSPAFLPCFQRRFRHCTLRIERHG